MKIDTALKTFSSLKNRKTGFTVTVSCDLDTVAYSELESNISLLRSYIVYAETFSLGTPMFYVTAVSREHFYSVERLIHTVNPDVLVGVHGCRHVHYTDLSFGEAVEDLKFCFKLFYAFFVGLFMFFCILVLGDPEDDR